MCKVCSSVCQFEEFASLLDFGTLIFGQCRWRCPLTAGLGQDLNSNLFVVTKRSFSEKFRQFALKIRLQFTANVCVGGSTITSLLLKNNKKEGYNKYKT